MRRVFVAAALLSLVAGGCSIERNGLGGRPVAGDGGGQDAGVRVEAGRGDGAADVDHDGVPASLDCDDTDPSIGTTAERECMGACSTGVEHCTDGVWAACDAPTSCTCTPGATRSLACAMCGTQNQVCSSSGTWTDDGGCLGQGSCSPGAVRTAGTCGMCGTLVQTCLDTCAWDAGTCSGEGVCMAGTVDTDTEPCGTMCGTEQRVRTCDSTCAWGTYSPFGACTVPSGACIPGTVQTLIDTCGACSNGTITGTRTCDASCTWSALSGGTCTGAVDCTTAFGRTLCPGDTGVTGDGCPPLQGHLCTCTATGSWTACGTCAGI